MTLTYHCGELLLHFSSHRPFAELSEQLLDAGCSVADAVRRGNLAFAAERLVALGNMHPTIRARLDTLAAPVR